MGRLCPACVNCWAWNRARIAEARLKAGARYYALRWSPRHVTVSFDHQEVPESPRDLQLQRAAVYRTLAQMGFMGGLAIFHKERKVCRGCGKPFEGRSCSGPRKHPNSGLDDDAVNRTCENPAFDWVDSPHFHVVGYGAVNAEDRPPGVVVKTIGSGTARSVRATIKYALDHAHAFERRHALTWFGAWSYSKLPNVAIQRFLVSCPKAKVIPRLKCERCGAAMVPLIYGEGPVDWVSRDFVAAMSDRPPPEAIS